MLHAQDVVVLNRMFPSGVPVAVKQRCEQAVRLRNRCSLQGPMAFDVLLAVAAVDSNGESDEAVPIAEGKPDVQLAEDVPGRGLADVALSQGGRVVVDMEGTWREGRIVGFAGKGKSLVEVELTEELHKGQKVKAPRSKLRLPE